MIGASSATGSKDQVRDGIDALVFPHTCKYGWAMVSHSIGIAAHHVERRTHVLGQVCLVDHKQVGCLLYTSPSPRD